MGFKWLIRLSEPTQGFSPGYIPGRLFIPAKSGLQNQIADYGCFIPGETCKRWQWLKDLHESTIVFN